MSTVDAAGPGESRSGRSLRYAGPLSQNRPPVTHEQQPDTTCIRGNNTVPNGGSFESDTAMINLDYYDSDVDDRFPSSAVIRERFCESRS